MKINTIHIKNDGYVICRSGFYTAQDVLSKHSNYIFTPGINKLVGEIDSGNWAISYLLSMYKYRPGNFVLSEPCQAIVNDEIISLKQLSEISCYMDRRYPLFSAKTSVRKLIMKGLKHSQSNYSYEELRQLFDLDSQRVERPLSQVGNEVFRAMAAIGLAYGKEIYCFPWLSHMRFEYYNRNMTGVLEILADLKKVAIVPVGAAPLEN